jgi:crotonobetaine/carnitine-CoA ligase
LADLPAELPPASSAAGGVDPGIEAECAILYTSGTTGRPKGCIITNRYCLSAGEWANGLGGAMQVAADGERLISPFPFTHMTALAVGLTSVILSNGCFILPDRFHPARWWDDCIATGATRMYYLGLVIPLLMKAPPAPQDRAHRLKVAAGGGVDPVLHAAFEERFGFPLIEVWGMTETGRIIAGTEEPRQVHTRAFGRSRPGLQARVAGEGDEEAPVGQPGELLVRHSAEAPRLGFFAGYLKDPDATEEAWRGGWFHTGDIVRRDEAGTLYFIDRRKNIVRRSGENIAAAEVETRLIEHPAVQSVGVTACPDPLRDEEVAAFIVLKPGTEPSEAVAHQLFDWCYARLAYFKAPGWISFLEELPVTGTHKVKKGELLKPGEMLVPGPTVFDLRALKRPGA